MVAESSNESNEEMDWMSKVFDSLSLPALILKPNGIVISANKIFLKHYGINKETIIGQTCHEFFFTILKIPVPMQPAPEPRCWLRKKGRVSLGG